MSKRGDAKSDAPVPQIVGFHVERNSDGAAAAQDASAEEERMGESSVPYLPPSKDEAATGVISSPSAAFLADAVEASALSSTPSLGTYLRSGNGGVPMTDTVSMSLADALAAEEAAGGAPPAAASSSTFSRIDANNSAFASTLSCSLDPVRRSFDAAAAAAAAGAPAPRPGAESTGGAAARAHANAPLAERLLSDAQASAGADARSARLTPSQGPSRATSDVASLEPLATLTVQSNALSTSTAGAARPKKGGGLSKAERRAKQEEQRAKKAAANAANEGGKGGKGKPPAKDDGERAPRHSDSHARSRTFDAAAATAAVPASEAPSGTGVRSLDMFSHLQPPRTLTVADALAMQQKQRLHPAILELGLAYANGTIAGSTHRAAAMLFAFKRVVADFQTPHKQAFSRSLSSHINACVGFLWDECRPACVPQRNSVKWLKALINTVPVAEGEEAARARIMRAIDDFVQEKFVMAQRVLCEEACKKLWDGDVVMTFGASQVVMEILLAAHAKGIRFEVLCVDARPTHTAEPFCAHLLQAGVPCSYLALHAVSHAMGAVTKVLLGASAVKSNGAVIARAGSALVAAAAARARKAVLICAQSIKFHDEVQLDSITSNERADPQKVLHVRDKPALTAQLRESQAKGRTSVLNLVYDAMPIDFITLIVTEFGLIPPTSVPVILREKQDDDATLMASA